MTTTIELSGQSEATDTKDISVKRQENSSGAIRLLVLLPRLVNAEHASLATALLFEQIDQLPPHEAIDKVKLIGLRFTPEGVQPLKEFLSLHAPSVKHVMLKNIVGSDSTMDEEKTFVDLAQAFQQSKLEILNLSDNQIGSNMWKHWSNQTGLRQLLLDHVELDDASIKELASHFTYGESLEDLYVVLTNPSGAIALGDACTILESCTNVVSVRWAFRTPDVESKLPWFGLRQMVSNQVRGGYVALLEHLVMDGSQMVLPEVGSDGLCGALRELAQLKTLKLRDVGLQDGGVRSVIAALQKSQPPLEFLDLSGNGIKASGASAIAQLIKVEAIVDHIKILALERNEIDTEAGGKIMHAFASKVAGDFKTRMNENPMDFSQLAMNLALAKVQVERERDGDLRRGQHRLTHSNEHEQNKRNVADLRALKAAYDQLAREKEVLAAAFSILSSSSQVNDHQQLLERVSRLEQPSGPGQHKERGLERRMSVPRIDPRKNVSLPNKFETPKSKSMQIVVQTPSSGCSHMSTMSSLTGIGFNPQSSQKMDGHGSSHTMSTSSSSGGERLQRSTHMPPSLQRFPLEYQNSFSVPKQRRSLLLRSMSCCSDGDSTAPAEVESVHLSRSSSRSSRRNSYCGGLEGVPKRRSAPPTQPQDDYSKVRPRVGAISDDLLPEK